MLKIIDTGFGCCWTLLVSETMEVIAGNKSGDYVSTGVFPSIYDGSFTIKDNGDQGIIVMDHIYSRGQVLKFKIQELALLGNNSKNILAAILAKRDCSLAIERFE